MNLQATDNLKRTAQVDRRVDRDDLKRSDEIRDEMECTRARLDQTLDELQQQLSPKELVHAAFEMLRENAGDITSRAACIVRNNPIPAALIGAGIAWFIVNQMRQRSSHDDEYNSDDLHIVTLQYEEEHILNPVI